MNHFSMDLTASLVLGTMSPELRAKLALLHRELQGEIFLAGGTVRDLLMQRQAVDVDLTVTAGAREWAEKLARLTGGAYVPLGRHEDAARVVWRKEVVDFTSFRQGASTFVQELLLRDITINSIGVRMDDILSETGGQGGGNLVVVDPANGMADIVNRQIRITSAHSFTEDPLRMLRVFRFSAVLDFVIDPDTLQGVRTQRSLIQNVAAERIYHELDLIMASDRAHVAFKGMVATGLLWEIIPELRDGLGVEQPGSHHLDVFHHNLETLHQVEEIISGPLQYFPNCREAVEHYLSDGRNRVRLKWAAFFHDIGKPVTCKIDEGRGNRITFYNHDKVGAGISSAYGRRLRWSSVDVTRVATLIAFHMRPFHLLNVIRSGTLTLKACVRLVKGIGDELHGLFILSMADALAGKGDERPQGIEQEVAELLDRMEQVRCEHVEPVRSGHPLLTGKDLVSTLRLAPGPIFKEILVAVEEAQMEQTITTHEEALELVRVFIANSLKESGEGWQERKSVKNA